VVVGVVVRVVVAMAAGVRMLILVCNGGVSSVIVPAAPTGVRMVMVSGMSMSVRLVAGMIVLMIMRILRNPLRLGMSARFPVLVTVRFGGAGVRHGGFLARFVV
jgi:hypothetical protein